MEGVPFVGNDACAHNLLLKGRPLIMRLQQLLSYVVAPLNVLADNEGAELNARDA